MVIKKFLISLIATVFVFHGVASADFSLGTLSDELTVGGVADPYTTVTFMIIDSDSFGADTAEATLEAYYKELDSDSELETEHIFYFKNLVTGADGLWEHKVPMNGIETKNLTLVSSSGNLEYIQYASVEFRTNMLPVIKSVACDSDDGEKLSEKITYYINYISDKSALYKNELNNKKKVAQLTKEQISQLNTEDENALKSIKTWIDDAIVVCGVNEGVIDSFDEAVSIAECDDDMKSTISEEGKEKVIHLLKNSTYETVDEYRNAVVKQVALQNFNYNVNQSADNLLDVLKENNKILQLDLSELYELDEIQQSKAAKKLAGKYSQNIKEAKYNLDEIVNDLKPKKNSGSGGGKSGSSIGIGSATNINESTVHGASASESITQEYVLQQKYIYSDMDKASWATDAIFYLSSKGIVNGYEDGTFRPLNPITRAEFVKLVVCTFFPYEQFELSYNFSDVDENSWYAQYVNTAYNMGIVSGDENGCFNPDDSISRQDMAVVIYNAGMKYNLFENTAEAIKFSDDESIADYAKTAIYKLKSNSVINGTGGGLFEPLANANRASASQILYNLILNNNR